MFPLDSNFPILMIYSWPKFMSKCLMLFKCFFCAYRDDHVLFVFCLFLLMWCITLFEMLMMSHPCDPRINLTWSWCMILFMYCWIQLFFPGGSAGEEYDCNVGDLSLIPGLGRSPAEGKGYPLQYSGLENSMDCIVHGVRKKRTQLSDLHFHFFPGRSSVSTNEIVHQLS